MSYQVCSVSEICHGCVSYLFFHVFIRFYLVDIYNVCIIQYFYLKNCITISDSVTRSLSLPVTDHTYEDCRLMIAAGELTLPMEAGLVEFTKISRKLEYDYYYKNIK